MPHITTVAVELPSPSILTLSLYHHTIHCAKECRCVVTNSKGPLGSTQSFERMHQRGGSIRCVRSFRLGVACGELEGRCVHADRLSLLPTGFAKLPSLSLRLLGPAAVPVHAVALAAGGASAGSMLVADALAANSRGATCSA